MAMACKHIVIARLERSATCIELSRTQSANLALVVLGVALQESLISRANAAQATSASWDRHQQHPHL